MNPVLWMELRMRIRERKLWIVSVAFLVCMAIISIVGVANVSRAYSWQQDPADIGQLLIHFEAGFLLALILILAPLAGAGRISQEREQRTLASLLNTPMSRLAIVLGKLLSSWVFVVWIWSLGLPFFTAAYLWGGMDLGQWSYMVLAILAAGITVASISLGMSGFFSRTLTSYLGTGIFLFFWLAAWPLLGLLSMNLIIGPNGRAHEGILKIIFFDHHPAAIFFAPQEPNAYTCCAVVWSALIAISIALAYKGLQRGLHEKP